MNQLCRHCEEKPIVPCQSLCEDCFLSLDIEDECPPFCDILCACKEGTFCRCKDDDEGSTTNESDNEEEPIKVYCCCCKNPDEGLDGGCKCNCHIDEMTFEDLCEYVNDMDGSDVSEGWGRDEIIDMIKEMNK